MVALPQMHSGIIIRCALPTKRKTLLLSREVGLHELCIIKNTVFMQGSLIAYTMREQRGTPLLSHAELLAVPERWVGDDILFLHQVLELVMFFVPASSNPQGLFGHMMLLFKELSINPTEWYKKIFLCRMFSLLGVYPDNAEEYDKLTLSLLSGPLEHMMQAHQRLEQHTLNAWVQGCVNSHPRRHEFKTYCFES